VAPALLQTSARRRVVEGLAAGVAEDEGGGVAAARALARRVRLAGGDVSGVGAKELGRRGAVPREGVRAAPPELNREEVGGCGGVRERRVDFEGGAGGGVLW
jgi:hypothetical protein